ncbi:asparagine synthetase B [Nocardioides glacieisoli]|uniref:asparagine synthase (glutamine-hydrolyzing) n=1 Tax=Nocardioides glacieisoli TaxID=1168730 RepID=A0A4Q2RXG8_9ACTN|nr:asparagine synthase-related protein [Nocardioides glacieisoli]RYB92589.1 asparagine synthetase B [Nocardioides glacieisoli]
MSGIGGVHAFARGAAACWDLVGMSDSLSRRGHGSSSRAGRGTGPTHTLLALDTDRRAPQPIHSLDQRWVVALDGEVDNHASLRAQLDYPFRTRSDAEVVVAGLALEGISFVQRLHGRFSIVAHDLRAGTTHLVRDRLGILPLYYRHVPGGVAFGSDVKSILALGPAPEVDERSLDAYLGTGVVTGPDTLFRGIKKVRPGHRVSLMPQGHLEEVRYWTLPEGDPDGAWSIGDAIEAVGDGVREAVRAALVGHEAVGVLLSGTLAGSIVAAEVQQLGDVPVHTYHVGLAEQPGNDAAWARHVSHLLGAEHHAVTVRALDFEDHWAQATWHREAPLTHPADVAVLQLARAACEQVQVVLSDDGSDELFGTHPRHRMARRLAERSAVLPAPLLSLMAGPAERRMSSVFTSAERRRLLGTDPPGERRLPPTLGAGPADRQLRHDVQHWLPDHLLERRDALSVAAPVVWRPALLDHHLVELAFRLPNALRSGPGMPLRLLREVARPLLPDEVVDRRPARSEVPWDSWFRRGLRQTSRDRLSDSGSWVSTVLDHTTVLELLTRHDRVGHDDTRLWTLLALEMWHECFFSTPPTLPRPRRSAESAAHVPRP